MGRRFLGLWHVCCSSSRQTRILRVLDPYPGWSNTSTHRGLLRLHRHIGEKGRRNLLVILGPFRFQVLAPDSAVRILGVPAPCDRDS